MCNPVIVSPSAASFDISAAGVGAAVGEYADLDDVRGFTPMCARLFHHHYFSADAAGFAQQRKWSVTSYNTTTVPAVVPSNSSFNIS